MPDLTPEAEIRLMTLLERAWRKQYDPDIQEIAEILGWDANADIT